MIVQITFQAPPRRDSAEVPTIHKRKLQGVPQPVAKEMLEDFKAYERNSSSMNPWKLYRYLQIGEKDQGEVTTPIDFREVVDVVIVQASPGRNGNALQLE
jgi:hypothetical protein